MNKATKRSPPRFVLAVAFLLLAGSWAAAENIDPGNDGSQYAWAENVGWINAEPAGQGGPGAQVGDFDLTGYLWGENVGWISLSCRNESSCGALEYGVINSGRGVLSGFAWAPNAGWVNFAPAGVGVVVDVTTGEFSGRAWGENVGWIAFSSGGANPFKVKAGWNCVPGPPAPTGSPALQVNASGASAVLSWGTIAGATGFDGIAGDLATLRSSGGNFTQTTSACVGNNRTTASASYAGLPAPGQGFWFLVRGENCAAKGTYDSGAARQIGLRDSEIYASGNDCP